MSENVYRDAADVIRKYGWVQGSFGTTERGFCLAGSVCFAITRLEMGLGISMKEAVAISGLTPLLEDMYPGFEREGYGVSSYNDKVFESVDEVIAVLEKAAAKLDEQV